MPNPNSFADDVSRSVRALSSELRVLLAEIGADDPIRTPRELEKKLGINYKLAWQIFKLANAPDPYTEAAHVPRRAAYKTLHKAILGKVESVDSLDNAYESFSHTVEHHAQDRAIFDSIVRSRSSNSLLPTDRSYRKSAYLANCHIYASLIRTRIAAMLVQPNESGTTLDVIIIRGLIGLTQLRTDRPIILSTTCHQSEEGGGFVPLMGSHPGGAEDSNMVPEFCSTPLPSITVREISPGVFATEVMTADVGHASAFTGVVCEMFKNYDSRYRVDNNDKLVFAPQTMYPTALNIDDVIIHKDTLLNSASPVFKSEIWNYATRQIGRSPDVLGAGNPVDQLRDGVHQLSCAEYPEYEQLVRHIMTKVNWNPDDFNVFRHRLEYPILSTATAISTYLPPAP